MRLLGRGPGFVCSGRSNQRECVPLETGSITVLEDGDILERNSEENVMLKKLDSNTLAPDLFLLHSDGYPD